MNDTPYPIYVFAEIRQSTLTFVLFGDAKEGTRRLESEVVEEVPFRALSEEGFEITDPSDATLLSAGRTGVRSRLYLLSEKGGESTRTLLRENLYPPKDAIYRNACKTASKRYSFLCGNPSTATPNGGVPLRMTKRKTRHVEPRAKRECRNIP